MGGLKVGLEPPRCFDMRFELLISCMAAFS